MTDYEIISRLGKSFTKIKKHLSIYSNSKTIENEILKHTFTRLIIYIRIASIY